MCREAKKNLAGSFGWGEVLATTQSAFLQENCVKHIKFTFVIRILDLTSTKKKIIPLNR